MDHLSRRERVATTFGLAAYFVVGYSSAQFATAGVAAAEHATLIDRLIPFSPAWVWTYVWAIPAAVMPAFIVSSRSLFRSAALAYFVTITASIACFMTVPLTATALRPPGGILDPARPSEWLLRIVYTIDPPRSLFPAVHVSVPALAAFVAWKADRVWGLIAFCGAALIAISACLIKQHFIIDVIGGLALASFVALPTLWRESPPPAEPRTMPVAGTAGFPAFVLAFYGSIAGACLLRWFPWTS